MEEKWQQRTMQWQHQVTAVVDSVSGKLLYHGDGGWDGSSGSSCCGCRCIGCNIIVDLFNQNTI